MYASITIDDVVDLLNLEVKPGSNRKGDSYYVKCPFCGGKHYKMNINRVKNFYRCNKCDSKGGLVHLYARVALGRDFLPGSQEGKEIFAQLKEDLGYNTREFKSKAKKREVATHHTISRAPDDVLDQAYSSILRFAQFKLSDKHRENLLKRGLTEEAIEKNQYRSIDPACLWTKKYRSAWRLFDKLNLYDEHMKFKSYRNAKLEKKEDYRKMISRQIVAGMVVAASLQKVGCQLEGVPGFYQLKGTWIFNISGGMLIPTRNIKGQVIGFQVRTENPKCRYITISSSGFPGGVNEGISRIHFPLLNPSLRKDSQIYITEGPLKSDVASDLLDHSVFFIAIQGVNNNRKDLCSIFSFLHDHGVERVVNALDMDKLVNPNVYPSCAEIDQCARKVGLKVSMKLWDEVCCEKQYGILCEIAEENAIEIPTVKDDNIFSKTAALTGTLIAENVSYNKERFDGDYWCSETKGIDDYLCSSLND